MAENRFVRWLKEYYDWCKDERKQSLEPNWGMAYDAFKGDYSSQYLDRWKELEGHDWRSKVFVRFTRRKIISAVSQIEDIIFQGGQLPYTIAPTPIPENVSGMFLPPEEADFRAENMKKRIDDINSENKYERVLRSSLLERAIYGMSIHKAPVIRPKQYLQVQFQAPRLAGAMDMVFGTQMSQKYGRHVMTPQTRVDPVIEHCNLWDIFWDMEAPDFQSGVGVIHRIMMSPGMLRRLEEQPGYDKGAIDQVISGYNDIENKTSGTSEDPNRQKLQKRRRGIEVVEFWGAVPKKELSGREEVLAQNNDGREVEITATVAYYPGSDGVELRPPTPNPLPLKRRPFNVGYWEEQPHSLIGVGMAENIQDAQMMINGAYRCFIDNKAFSSSLMLAFTSGALKPGQNMSPRVGGTYEFQDHIKDIRQALQWIAPPDNGAGTLDLISLAERFGDEDSGHPKLMQGETATHSPKTAFETSQLLEAANKQIGRVIRNQDEGLIEPDIEAQYHYLLLTEEDESIKGDFTSQATGFAGYNDKIIRRQSLMGLIQFQLSNEILTMLLKAPDAIRELWRVNNFDPDQFLKTDEELEMDMANAMAGVAGVEPPPVEGEVPMEPAPMEQPIPRRKGGPVTAGKPYIVGEEGPEIIVPEQDGNVIPNNTVEAATALDKFAQWARSVVTPAEAQAAEVAIPVPSDIPVQDRHIPEYGFEYKPTYLESMERHTGDLTSAMRNSMDYEHVRAALDAGVAGDLPVTMDAGALGTTAGAPFRKWFGKSKVKETVLAPDPDRPWRKLPQEQPKVQYHGSTQLFDSFDNSKLSDATGHETSKLGFFFSAAPVANMFAKGEGAAVYPVYLSIKKPYRISGDTFIEKYLAPKGADWREGDSPIIKDAVSNLKSYLQQKGYDGIIISPTTKQKNAGWRELDAENYIAFKPEQIKSKFNQGTFNPNDPDMLMAFMPLGTVAEEEQVP